MSVTLIISVSVNFGVITVTKKEKRQSLLKTLTFDLVAGAGFEPTIMLYIPKHTDHFIFV